MGKRGLICLLCCIRFVSCIYSSLPHGALSDLLLLIVTIREAFIYFFPKDLAFHNLLTMILQLINAWCCLAVANINSLSSLPSQVVVCNLLLRTMR